MRFEQLGASRAARRAAEQRGEDSFHTIRVPISELEKRAAEVEVFDVRPFLNSRLFSANGYRWIERERCITKTFGEGGSSGADAWNSKK